MVINIAGKTLKFIGNKINLKCHDKIQGGKHADT